MFCRSIRPKFDKGRSASSLLRKQKEEVGEWCADRTLSKKSIKTYGMFMPLAQHSKMGRVIQPAINEMSGCRNAVYPVLHT